MLTSIKSFFRQHISPSEDVDKDLSEHALHLACAALMFEVSRMDFSVQQEEIDTMARLLMECFSLPAQEVQDLTELARREVHEASSYHEFTSLIHQHFPYPQKVRVVEMMWQVAFADGSIDRYEEHLIRKVAELLYLEHVDFIAAKHRARKASS